jgi:hypothetical protein
LGKHGFVKVGVLLVVSVLALSVVVQTADAAVLENVTSWSWDHIAEVNSVAVGDVDKDGKAEIVTGGHCYPDPTVAQLCIWNGATLTLETVKTWSWGDSTFINSVAIGDVDGDGWTEIVTGGYYDDGTRRVAQLCVWSWNNVVLMLDKVQTWFWTGNTAINSIAIGDVDGDGNLEIVTGGYYDDGSRNVAQLCVWNWNGGAMILENVRTWYWGHNTAVSAVAVGDVDGDGGMEIVTGGGYWDGENPAESQLCVWSGASLAFEKVKTFHWGYSDNGIWCIAIGNVDNDASMEIVTGSSYWDGPSYGLLCVWSGLTLGLESYTTWGTSVHIYGVSLGDVDGDGKAEIVTGGTVYNGSYMVFQLCVWSTVWGTYSMVLENNQTWLWGNSASVNSVAIGDVDGGGLKEIITGGEYFDGWGGGWIAQLCVWEIGGSIL